MSVDGAGAPPDSQPVHGQVLSSERPPADPAHLRAAGVAVAGVTKSFGTQPVLHGVDLEVPEGSVTAILGPSGSGKTTLLRLLAGFERADAGTIAIGGSLVEGPGRHVAPEVRRVGYVPQEGSLFPHLDVRANVGFGLPRARRRARVDELLEMTGLSEMGGRFPHQLSGGQQQRVALARALAPDPPLVLLDEPFTSLDAFLRTSVRLDVLQILRRAGTTAVIVTHDQDEALSMADQVAVLLDGLVVQCGTPEEVYTRPADATLARFVGGANLLAGTIRSGRVDTVFGPLPLVDGSPDLAEGAAAFVLLRPEQIRLVPPGAPGTVPGVPGTVPGVVVQSEYYGHDTVVTVDIGGTVVTGGEGGPARISVRCAGAPALAPGSTVALRATGAVPAWGASLGGAGRQGTSGRWGTSG